jgi:FtsP/CotA-like multicopper oxidase with cupredoxin domain
VTTQFGAAGLTVANLDGSGYPLNGTGLPSGCWPTSWPTDGREGGVPDPATAGPPIIQIGSEGGLLPAPAAIPSTPINYEYARRSVTVLNVLSHGLFLGPAERADVVVDFSAVPAGSILILYNDAPAPVPALDSRIDYYTGDPDQTDTGGAPSTQPGYGPNTRTIMQIAVQGSSPNAVPFSLPALAAALPNVFAATQDPIIVPETVYPAANGGTATPTYSRIFDTTATFVDHGSSTPTVHQLLPKTIQELFTLDYGRMNATLGVELPFTSFLTQTTIPYGYFDPSTEIVKDGETQLWKITHNGVDTHFIHFHLFTVQVVNRVGWDGAIKPPDPNELSFKDTVRMNPLEDIVVALKPIKQQNLPWPLPDSIRPMDVTMPTSSTAGFTNVDPANNPIVPNVVNRLTNFGWEYVWHCHILGHEENDMMRPVTFQVAPEAPTGLAAATPPLPGTGVTLTWTDASASETSFAIERADDSGFTQSVTPFSVAASVPNTAHGATLNFNDPAGTPTHFYRVRAVDDNFKPPLAQAFNTTPALLSDWAGPVSIAGTPAVVITADAVVIPAPNGAGWINLTPVTVRITASENNGPAFQSITYSATGAQVIPPTTVGTNPADVSISAQGVTVVSFQATDANGKSSAARTVTVKLDTTSPTAALTPAPNAAGWNCCNTVFTITGSDGLSGVATIDYSSSGASILAATVNGSVATFNLNEGMTTIAFFATDAAGNVTSPQVQAQVQFDRTAPTITAASNPPQANRANKSVKVNVTGTATDALSLMNNASGSYSVKNGSNVVVATGTFTVSNGAYTFPVTLSINTRQTYTITVSARDQADNVGTAITTFVVR